MKVLIMSHFSGEMGILSKYLNVDDVNFDGDDPKTIIYVRYMAWHNRFKQCKAFKKR